MNINETLKKYLNKNNRPYLNILKVPVEYVKTNPLLLATEKVAKLLPKLNTPKQKSKVKKRNGTKHQHQHTYKWIRPNVI